MQKPSIYAIDYGTSNSILCAANSSETFMKVSLDQEAEDPRVLKSILYSQGTGDWIFGSSAIRTYAENPSVGRIFKSLKRFLPDPSFKGTRVGQETLTVSDLIAKQLRFMRETANRTFENDVRSLVLGCPAVFSENSESNQCAFTRLKSAAQAAGFENIEFCPEPIAAAYKFRHQLTQEKMVLVADFGGGTSDFTILKLGPKKFKPSDVLSLGGVSIAGDRYDSAIMQELISPHFGSKIKYKKPMSKNELSFPKGLVKKMSHPADITMLNTGTVLDYIKEAQRYITKEEDSYKIDQLLTLIEEQQGYALFKLIEDAKIELSKKDLVSFQYEYPMINVSENIPKPLFESSSKRYTDQIIASMDDTIRKAGLTSTDIDIVCLTGGTANIPAIKKSLYERFGDKLALSDHFHSVAQGLADHAQSLC